MEKDAKNSMKAQVCEGFLTFVETERESCRRGWGETEYKNSQASGSTYRMYVVYIPSAAHSLTCAQRQTAHTRSLVGGKRTPGICTECETSDFCTQQIAGYTNTDTGHPLWCFFGGDGGGVTLLQLHHILLLTSHSSFSKKILLLKATVYQ